MIQTHRGLQLKEIILALCVSVQPLLTVIQVLLGQAGFMSEASAANFRVVSSALFVLLAFPIVLKRNFVLTLITYIIFILLFSYSLITNPLTQEYIINEGLKLTLPICLPVFLSYVSMRDRDLLMKVLLIVSGFITLVGVLYTFFLLQGRLYTESIYNMSIGYSLLYPMVLFFSSKKTFLQLVSFILMALVFFIGSRGPVIVFGVYVIISLLRRKRLSSVLPVILLALIVFYNLDSIFVILEKFFGFESRSLYLLTSGEMLSHIGGREDIYATAKKALNEVPLLGYGIFGDRVALNAFSHNFFIEVILDFGYIFGVTFLVIFFLIIIRTYLKSNSENRDILLIFFVMSMVPLMVSGSFTKDISFYIFLGVIYSLNHQKRKAHVYINSSETIIIK